MSKLPRDGTPVPAGAVTLKLVCILLSWGVMNFVPDLLLCAADGVLLGVDRDTRRRLSERGLLNAAADAQRLDALAAAAQGGEPTIVFHAGGLEFHGEPVRYGGQACVLLHAGEGWQARPSLAAARWTVLHGLYEGIVHDLRSPLNSLAMNAEMLRYSRDAATRPEGRERRESRYLDAIATETERLGAAVSALVEFFDAGVSGRAVTSTAWLLDEVRRFAAPALRGRNVDLLRTDCGPPVQISVSESRMRLALLALILASAAGAAPGDALRVQARAHSGRAELAGELRRGDPGARPAGQVPQGLGAALVTAVHVINADGGELEFGDGAASAWRVYLPEIDRGE